MSLEDALPIPLARDRTGVARRAAVWIVDELPSLAGLALVAFAVCARSHDVVGHFSPYDEGILLSDSYFVLRGLAPYRDFYADYPPGIFWLLAGAWKIFGISAWVYRLIAIGLNAGVALMAGRIAGRMTGRPFALLAAGAVSVWLILLGVAPYAWMAGLLCAFVAIDRLLWARDRGGWQRYGVAGIAFGSIAAFRYELFGYFLMLCVASAAMAVLLHAVGGLAPHLRVDRRCRRAFFAGAAIVIGVVWIPTFVMAGHLVLRDLVFDLARYIVPARRSPMPDVIALDPATHFPVFLSQELEGAVAFTLAGPALFALLFMLRRPLRLWDSLPIILTGLLSIAVLPQMMIRTDLAHAQYTLAPALIAAVATFEATLRRARNWGAKVCVLLLFPLLIRPVHDSFWPLRSLWTDGMAEPLDQRSSARVGFYEEDPGTASIRRTVIDFVQSHSAPGERVFFGNVTHEHVVVNEVDLYFLADRLPGVRYTQYEPNMVTRREVQEEMIASLEKYQVKVAVLSSRFGGSEDSYAIMPGSNALDRYITEHFRLVDSRGAYRMLLRSD